MSEPGATARRRRSRRAAPQPSRVRRPLIAIASVVLVITPISWILLHEPQNDQADASIPYVSRDDDTYITASADPAAVTTEAPTTATPSTPPTPGQTPTPTPVPTTTPTPGQTPGTTAPTDAPTDGPTDWPTDGPTGRPTSTPTDPPTGGATTPPQPPPDEDSPGPQPTRTPTPTRTTTSSPPPEDEGNMSPAELELFHLVDNARQERGCAPLRRNNDLSDGAGSEAEGRASSGDVAETGSSKAAAGGDSMTAKTAFDRLKADSSRTLFNCGLDELGVGRGTATRETGALCGLLGVCTTRTRVAWVVDFD
ncbi:hypothetical protein Kfla_1294 [Kribbella flavida DSM 17836]|uniref:SCP-like extracellular n=1 Tax=Kribbella flavida (strain DSM 17836 / JCM 10339 / NBRC 14399) TaxID=479435 RepID=D2Q483_KRIFD|nr:hypothetical protein [Kribbella flavida]ADB30397.1 hypothetical protein Kfla_1294 [Kribbella flavida DSM 17836]